MPRLAIIGTGIAGLGCAHFLRRHFDLTLFEQNDWVGGHANTIAVPELGTGRVLPIDTGFMVYNEAASPQLTRLFTQLRVAVKPAPLSFSVRHVDTGLEFGNASLNHVFAQRKNLFNPQLWRLLGTIRRFAREAVAALEEPETGDLTLGEYVRRQNYGDDFFRLYLMPLSSALWSLRPEGIASFPAGLLLRFFHQQGFLGLHPQHTWRTVEGGAKTYVEKISAPFRDRIKLGQKAVRVLRHASDKGVTVTTAEGAALAFDKVILACPANQTLRLLVNPTDNESRLFGEFHYQTSVATVHTDASVMPRARRTWSSWNSAIEKSENGDIGTSTHFWMNSLQGVSDRENYFVTIDGSESIAAEKILKRITYDRPRFSLGTFRAQNELPALNTASPAQATYFCGSYFRSGFHEDALASAARLAEILLQRDPWQANDGTRPSHAV